MVRPRLALHQRRAVDQLLLLLDHRGGALLADEVGLGKSWVAAAVGLALSPRFPVEVIVPRALVTQWRDLLISFELEAEILTHDGLHGRAFAAGEGEPRLLIVDEAHRFRNVATNRHRALALRSAGNLLLLVTATPVCNRLEDLHALIRLMAADDALADAGVLSIQQAFEEPVPAWLDRIRAGLVLRRSREVLPQDLRFGRLRRDVIRFAVACEPEVRADLNALRFPLLSKAKSTSEILRRLLRQRLESSPAALLDSLRRQKRFYHRAREALESGQELTRRDYRRIFGDDPDEVFFQDLLFRELWSGPSAAGAQSLTQVEPELEILSRLEASLRQAGDAKAALLQSMVQHRDGVQILIFTSAVATAREIFSRLAPSERVALLTSRYRWLQRSRDLTMDQVLESFRRGAVRILVLTDLGAEGLNLQNAGVVIHYDLPWNPVLIDQRNGRTFRIGQRRAEIEAIYFLPENRSDRVIMRVVAAKNRVRRRFLASSVAPLPIPRPWDPLPPRLRKSDPPALLFARLGAEKLLAPELLRLMLRRYRFGVELIMRQLAAEFLDSSRCAFLEDLLRRELSITGADSPPASPPQA